MVAITLRYILKAEIFFLDATKISQPKKTSYWTEGLKSGQMYDQYKSVTNISNITQRNNARSPYYNLIYINDIRKL
jgi:hypothetical protein